MAYVIIKEQKKTASCSRYNDEESCVINSPNITKDNWLIIGWKDELETTNVNWNVNKEKFITTNLLSSAITARYLKEAIIEDNGGEEEILSRGIPNFNTAAVSYEIYNQLSTTELTTLFAKDGKSLTYNIQKFYFPSNGLYKTSNEIYDSENDYGIFTSQDDNDGPSYYFRGDIDNNFVLFAGYWWRIIRINGDGSIRLIYNGKSAVEYGVTTEIGTSKFNDVGTDNAYLGYMYGNFQGASTSYEEAHTNEISSTMKIYIEEWYANNIHNQEYDITSKIAYDAIFCGDRNIREGHLGYGNFSTSFGSHERSTMTQQFSFQCKNNTAAAGTSLNISVSNDQYSMIGSGKGNEKLQFPVGLISADEVRMAGSLEGGVGSNRLNGSFWLYTGRTYATMSPEYPNNDELTRIYRVSSAGIIGANTVINIWGVRPVINLKNNVISSGNGTSNSPYIIF